MASWLVAVFLLVPHNCADAAVLATPGPSDCRRELWMVSSRAAPVCRGLDRGVDCLTYWRHSATAWVEYSREEFVAAVDPSLPTSFYVHGNTVNHSRALKIGRQVHETMSRSTGSFRLVIWSWPSQFLPGYGFRGNIEEKAARSESQGYYLAWVIGQLDPRTPLTLVGHSFGTRTVTAALQGLAAGRIAGHELPPFEMGERRIRAALVGAAMDNRLLNPGACHGEALSQVERMLVTYNPQDRILKVYARVSGLPVMGLTGINQGRLGADAAKVKQLPAATWAGPAHRWPSYADAPVALDYLRAFFSYDW